VIEKQLIMI